MSLGSEVGGGITRTSAIDWGGIVIEQLSRGDAWRENPNEVLW